MRQKGLDFGTPEPARGARASTPAASGRREAPEGASPRRRALTVSELTDRIQSVLEPEFADVWVEGEVSNLKIATSGHWYFSLKDDAAQIRAVVWKTATRLIRFRPKDGLKVVARGALRVWPPRGEYQLSVEVLEPLGKGALQQAFEELKEKLAKEGLFDPARKRPLPLLPRRVGIVTSPTGAVIQDFLRVLHRRHRNVDVVLFPARVQGDGASWEIVEGIRALDRVAGLDVLIVARGGGSLEDLWPFNDEAVARALAASRVPTISAVGHETDFTIADFVADLRAPTPSAAAERVVQAKEDLAARIATHEGRLRAALDLRLTRVRARVAALTAHRVFEAERGRIRGHAQRVDDLARRAGAGLLRGCERVRDRARSAGERVEAFRWDRQIAGRRERLGRQSDRLEILFRAEADARRAALGRLAGMLDGLSPLAVLSRGYALVWDAARGRLVRSPAEVEVGDPLRVRVHGGRLDATVTRKEPL
ncbi:MAG: exodeoxyribonuclease VII large subunit [Acidobacteria bacterium]|nr:exodeoxyribonuclease VII large subunit [Acidobacteriota bacterium]